MISSDWNRSDRHSDQIELSGLDSILIRPDWNGFELNWIGLYWISSRLDQMGSDQIGLHHLGLEQQIESDQI